MFSICLTGNKDINFNDVDESNIQKKILKLVEDV